MTAAETHEWNAVIAERRGGRVGLDVAADEWLLAHRAWLLVDDLERAEAAARRACVACERLADVVANQGEG
jgi:hypothetical protein